ncbi:MAG TPA: ATP-binding cassette domain-containing protein, partial [Opitutales bacterium]|nr:ATP-binding cassette domain-containing protein [Opitutales bacterium]
LHHAFVEGAESKEVLHGISAEFARGEICLIMGPSGSGKTTLLKLIGGQRAIQRGSIVVDGHELAGVRPRDLVAVRRKIGFIFQLHHLIEALTVCQNVQMPLTFDAGQTAATSRTRALELLERVGIAEHAHKHPSHLSGGQKQRVAIARALVNHPSIILADEPTASLDGKTGHEIVELMQKLAQENGCTIVLVTHDNRIMDIADRLIHLVDGKLNGTTAK